MILKDQGQVLVHQTFEGFELIGYETRNKYVVLDKGQNKIAFAAEQQKGFLGFLARQFLGHWRKFTVAFFDNERKEIMRAIHPFRFFFQRLDIEDVSGRYMGGLQQRFSILSKKFDVLNHKGEVVMEMSSPIWKIWTFPVFHNEQEVACIQKKWSGFLSEMFTDKDKFLVEFKASDLSEDERRVLLAASVFIDLQYFERKAK
jgi:uncharacterized protein YxjI